MSNPWIDQRIAPNGQRVQDNFCAWFGESKVIDAFGQPLVVYHGTFSDFSSFDASKMGANVNEDDFGFFFSNNPIEASGYADLALFAGSEPGVSPNVMPVYLSIRNPRVFDITDETRPGYCPATWYDEYGQAEARKAIDAGHDGLIIADFSNDPLPNPLNGVIETLYVAFSPQQIKSAIGNSGLYLPDSACSTDQQAAMRLIASRQATRVIETAASKTMHRKDVP